MIIIHKKICRKTTFLELDLLLEKFAKYVNLNPEAIKGKTRLHEIAHPRFMFFWIAKNKGYSIRAIALYFKMNRASVIHGRKKVLEDDLMRITAEAIDLQI